MVKLQLKKSYNRYSPPVHEGGAVNLHPRLLQVALFCSSRTHNSNSCHRCFSPLLESFSKSSAQAVSLGLAAVVASVATAASVYAKEPPPAGIMPKEVVLYQYEACPFCNKVKGTIIDQLGEKILPEKTKTSVADEDEETKWRRWVDNHLVHVLSPNIYRNTSEALESFDHITSNGNFSFTEKITVKYAGAAAIRNLGGSLNGRNFLEGSKPNNLADLAVFGVLRPIRCLRSGRDMVEHTRIGEWYSRMEKVVREPSRVNA
ncbi:auxin efflux carrier component 1-like [Hibiscus syriacus]|uniref:Auxin efflux carrier component 1-like n=1 Tax=Hibiscus syriacus TaxID=106335 RepID=A0A6A3AL46_HIBSY|nr:auxin efflux carrier component 1-like [Hibiscus syriacus]